MIKKYWILIIAFLVSLGMSIYFIQNGVRLFSKDIEPIITSIIITSTIILGMVLFIWIRMDLQLKDFKLSPEQLKEQENWAGKIEVIDEQLVYSYGKNERIQINLSDLKVIGEMTTDADSIAVDWYLIFVKNNNELIYIPAYAVGIQDALKNISITLKEEIVPMLFACVKFDSNVIFPQVLHNNKLFYFDGLSSKSAWVRLQVKFGFKPITPILRNEIVEFVK